MNSVALLIEDRSTVRESHGSDSLIPHRSADSVIKRIVDIIGSSIGLFVLALMFLPLAIAIKLETPGPVFFSQQRHGLNGKPFTIYKFRSMVINADNLKHRVKNEASGLIFKNFHDPRVTRVGKFLRSTSLDEFPQFWNVLLGDMSLVGTRPPTTDEVRQYNARHWRRLNVKPGITGEWQVNGRSEISDFEEIVDLDLRYQQCWTPLYDFTIIWKTFYVVFAKVGAV